MERHLNYDELWIIGRGHKAIVYTPIKVDLFLRAKNVEFSINLSAFWKASSTTALMNVLLRVVVHDQQQKYFWKRVSVFLRDRETKMNTSHFSFSIQKDWETPMHDVRETFFLEIFLFRFSCMAHAHIYSYGCDVHVTKSVNCFSESEMMMS